MLNYKVAMFASVTPINKWKPLSSSSRTNAFTGETLKINRNKHWNGSTIQFKPSIAHIEMKNLNRLGKNYRDYLEYYRKPQFLSQSST